MKRSLAAVAALSLSVALAACSSDDGSDGSSDQATAASPGVGEVENQTYPRGAPVGDFCAVAAEIDAAIDGVQAGDEESWQRVVAAFEGLDALGVPDDLPDAAVTELVQQEIVAQQSTSAKEFLDVLAVADPSTTALTGYIDDHCG